MGRRGRLLSRRPPSASGRAALSPPANPWPDKPFRPLGGQALPRKSLSRPCKPGLTFAIVARLRPFVFSPSFICRGDL